MLVWMGKNHLGQKDKQEIEHQGKMSVRFDAEDKDL